MTYLCNVIRILFFAVFLLSEVSWIPEHGLYLSVTEIEVYEGELTATVKVFSDDLYSCMLNRDVTIESSIEEIIKEEIEAYFAVYFNITESQKPIEMKLESFSEEGDSYFLQFSCPQSIESDKIKIQLGYFYELFPTQRNILKFKTKSGQHHGIFKSKDQIETISF
ncbi:MAG: hypothetical protein ACI9FN_003354 [Saprospiraceae bacterium]|jgi:hypothetical protein